jgi:hypothetical protein
MTPTIHDQVVATLQANYLGSHWNLTGDTYEGFVWLDDPSTKPTAVELGL